MKKVWSKNTQDPDGKYFRTGDWGCNVPDEYEHEGITEVSPSKEILDGVPGDWNEELQRWDISPTAYAIKRKEEYLKENITVQAMIVALWEKEFEDRPEAAIALQAKRVAVKAKYLKGLV